MSIIDPKDKLSTVLANERTFAAWIRTGLAFLVSGIATAHFFSNGWNAILIKSVGTVLILFGALCFGLSSFHFWKLETRLLTKEVQGAPHTILFIFSFLLVAFSFATLLFVWA